jgi:hypothetical protein
MADWDRDLEGFALLLGLDPIASVSEGYVSDLAVLPPLFVEQARHTTAQRGATYEGFWRTTRPSVIMEGQFFHDYGMIRIAENGLLQVRMGSQGLVFEGIVFPAEGNIFSVLYDAVGATPLFLIFRGVPLPKADVLDGLMILAALNAERTPAAVPVLLERIGDLSGNAQDDDQYCAQLFARNAIVPEHDLRPEVIAYMRRDIGPAAAEAGGAMFLMTSSTAKFSRGATLTGQLRG